MVAEISKNAQEMLATGFEGLVYEKDGKTPRAIQGGHLHNPYFEKLIRHPLFLDNAREILQSEVYLHQFRINYKQPFSGERWPWHQDYIFWQKLDYIPEMHLVNIAIFLDEINPFNGPLFLVPGSHLDGVITPKETIEEGNWKDGYGKNLKFTVPDAIVPDLVDKHGIVSATGGKGTLLFFNPNTVHGSAGNISPYPRRMLLLTYNSVNNLPTRKNSRPEFVAGQNFEALRPSS